MICIGCHLSTANGYAAMGQAITGVKIDQLALAEKQAFSLRYDFGDDWMFPIKVMKIEDVDMAAVPKVIKQKGHITANA